jgi:enoyl-CoA hydratase/carnithine racemase
MAVVLVEKQTPQITLVTLNRPERRNSLTIELLTELVAAVTAASSDTQQRVLILRGAGAAFCTGQKHIRRPRWSRKLWSQSRKLDW